MPDAVGLGRRLPLPRHRAVVHRQHRHLAVRRLQHAGADRPAQGRTGGAVRGGADRRGERLAGRPAHQAPADPAGARAHHASSPSSAPCSCSPNPLVLQPARQLRSTPATPPTCTPTTRRSSSNNQHAWPRPRRCCSRSSRACCPSASSAWCAAEAMRDERTTPRTDGCHRRPRRGSPRRTGRIIIRLAADRRRALLPGARSTGWSSPPPRTAPTSSAPSASGSPTRTVDNLVDVLTYDDGIYVRWSPTASCTRASARVCATLLSRRPGYALAKFRVPRPGGGLQRRARRGADPRHRARPAALPALQRDGPGQHLLGGADPQRGQPVRGLPVPDLRRCRRPRLAAGGGPDRRRGRGADLLHEARIFGGLGAAA